MTGIEKLIDDATLAFTDREISPPSRDDLRIALQAFEASLARCGCEACTIERRRRIALTDHDRTALARALHEIVYSPGATYDRAVPGIQEHMLACAEKVAAALPWLAPHKRSRRAVPRSGGLESGGREALAERAIRAADEADERGRPVLEAWPDGEVFTSGDLRSLATDFRRSVRPSTDAHDPLNCPDGRGTAACLLDCPHAAQSEPSDAVPSEQRDQWGETAEERHARILARDLAWMTYAEACARDGVPRSERDHLIFNDGYAAGRADYLPAAGVVAEEPQWEWGFRRDDSGTVHPHPTREDAEQSVGLTSVMSYPSGRLVRRRKAGPWVPVKQEGESDGA